LFFFLRKIYEPINVAIIKHRCAYWFFFAQTKKNQ
jgi:hypothetical protein